MTLYNNLGLDKHLNDMAALETFFQKGIKIFIICVITAIGILLVLYMMVWYIFWADQHTYYDMDKCSLQQSREIFEIMGLELYDGITIEHVSYHLADGSHVSRYFSFELSGNIDVLSQYMAYLEQNSTKELKNESSENYSYQIYLLEFHDSQSILTFRYALEGHSPADLPSYICQYGTRHIKILDNN